MTSTGHDYALDLVIRPHSRESQRLAGHHLLSFRWWDLTAETQYTDFMPIQLRINDPVTLRILDYTKLLVSPTVKVEFKPLPGNVMHSPFDASTTETLANGASPNGAPVLNPDYTLHTLGPYYVLLEGTDYEFAIDIDDESDPQAKWFVDPQMIVEGSG